MSADNTGSVLAAVEGDGAPNVAPGTEIATGSDAVLTLIVPGTDAMLEIDLQALSDAEAQALVHPNVVLADLPDLVPHSGENFGKPSLTGDNG